VNGAAGPGSRGWGPAAVDGAEPEAPGWRRTLQLALAALWLLDAVLQKFQTFMFSQGFPRMLAQTAAGNPGPVAGPVTWSAHLVGTHPGAATAVFGTVQLLLAIGIAWRRPTDHGVDVMHAVMGVAMAGMLVPRLNPLQARAWAVLFQIVMGVAMAYMLILML
jgi:hypothetical protein